MSGILLKDGETSILDMSEIETFLTNYKAEVESTKQKISQAETSLTSEKENLKNLYAQNLLSPSDTYRTDINESEATISNYENIIALEKERLTGLEKIPKENSTFQSLLESYSAQIREDVATFKNIDEKAIWNQLADLRNQQEELFRELITARSAVYNAVGKFNGICKYTAGRNDLTTGIDFHKNLRMVNPVAPEAGILFPNTDNTSNILQKFDYAKRGIQR